MFSGRGSKQAVVRICERLFSLALLSHVQPHRQNWSCVPPLFFNGNEKPQKFRQHYWGITLSYGFHENINAAFILMTENANAALPD